MATRNAAREHIGDRSVVVATWSGLLNTDDGAPIMLPQWPDRTVQVTGTFGTGGTVLIEGSNDGTTYNTINDTAGSALSFSAAGFKVCNEVPLYLRPRVSAGDGTTSLKVAIVLRTPTAIVTKS